MSFRINMNETLAEECLNSKDIYKYMMGVTRKEVENAFFNEVAPTLNFNIRGSDLDNILNFSSKILLNNLISNSRKKEEK